MDNNSIPSQTHPSEDEIVISGMSGKFPNSRNIAEFSHNLYNKIDMVDDKATRWSHIYGDLPKRFGKIPNIEKFDAHFFGLNKKQCKTIEPQSRLLIEPAYEAILDAGINPAVLRNTKTGVFIGMYTADAERELMYESFNEDGLAIPGGIRSMLANRISFCLNLQGPSMVLDTGCSSAMYALHSAILSMNRGECDAALVGGTNLILHPSVSQKFFKCYAISPDGYSRPFDENASGFSRSEAIAVLFLQKRKHAKRIYASVLHTRTNCDGYKREGITYPSSEVQKNLLNEFYSEIKIDPSLISYFEAHGTGTIVGDPVECHAIDNAICAKRTAPLLIGAVKSNMGHSEASSAVCSIIKVILALESKLVPPNINITKIKNIPPLIEGRLKVCKEATKLNGSLIAINSFGLGGANAHTLVYGNQKEKKNNDSLEDTLPRLVTWSGRTKESIDSILEYINSNPLDTEFVGLLHNIQSVPTSGHNYRGFGIFERKATQNPTCLAKEIEHVGSAETQRPVVWVFSGMGSQWSRMGSDLLNIPLFRDSIESSHAILKPFGVDIKSIITSNDRKVIEKIENIFVGIAAIQMGLVDVLKALGLQPDIIVGHSVGEIGCAYADGSFTAEQMLLTAYSRGMVSAMHRAELTRGAMAAVGMGYDELKNEVMPSEIEIACHNGCQSSTISGPEHLVIDFVAELKMKGIFAKIVPTANIAYHSKYITPLGPKLLERLKQIIPNPKRRSDKWLSSSVPKTKWGLKESQFCSAEYHTNNFLSPVLFEEVTSLLPSNAILIEIAPRGLLQAILKRSMTQAVYIPITNQTSSNNAVFFLSALGKIFMNGLHIPVFTLYPTIEFPVSRGTAGISSLIKWDHSDDHYVSNFGLNIEKLYGGERKIVVDLDVFEFKYFSGHNIDGLCLVPGSAYIRFAWESLAKFLLTDVDKLNVEFEDIRFIRATSLKRGQSVEFLVNIHSGTGRFEITEKEALVMSGVIRPIDKPISMRVNQPSSSASTFPMIESNDFYKELKVRGYYFNGEFRSVAVAQVDGLYGKIVWRNNWTTFLDGIFQINILSKDTRNTILPTRIQKLRINTEEHMERIRQLNSQSPIIDVHVQPELNRTTTGCVELTLLTASTVNRRKNVSAPVLENYQFVPYFPKANFDCLDAIRMCVQLSIENCLNRSNRIVEISSVSLKPIIENFDFAYKDTLVDVPELILLTETEHIVQNVQIVNENITLYKNCQIVVGAELIAKREIFLEAAACLQPNGLLISREFTGILKENVDVPADFGLLSIIPTEFEYLVVFIHTRDGSNRRPVVINVTSNDDQYSWLPQLQESNKNGDDIIILSQNDKISGTLGLVNCLRKEPSDGMVSLVLIDDGNAPAFDIDLPFYKDQLKFHQAVNIFRMGEWGTYRHLRLQQRCIERPRTEYSTCNLMVTGDLTTFRWFEGFNKTSSTENTVAVHYCALNFRDVMLATGRISMDLFTDERLKQELVLGFEFSGVDENGKRVMGASSSANIGTQVFDPHLMWTIPDSWSLQEAATVPVVYSTVYLALFMKNPISKGKSILIHAGSGGIGISAIRVALAYGMIVFTTVSTPLKKKYLLDLFPSLEECNIGNSRDCTFEEMIKIQTNGKGVDYVLNSLTEEKLLASIRCLADGGTFLEIGKFDMVNDTKIGMSNFLKNIKFHSVLGERLIGAKSQESEQLYRLIERDIENGIIKPLDSTVFEVDEVEQAFRYLSTGKHIGKVLIRIQDQCTSIECVPIKVLPKVNCDPAMVYVIPGGLGGFGLELADWLILRGARKIVLSSSRGISNSYQTFRMKIWESYSCKIVISTKDIATVNGCKELLNECLCMGPIGGIFNLAVVLSDSMLENQSPSSFVKCVGPKALCVQYLDKLSREMCPDLKYFVVFSSVVCGRGNAGQTNYGLANSIMERIVEQRVADGLPGKAIQWGAIGDVGLVAEKVNFDSNIFGAAQQRLYSCLAELDILVTTPSAVVSCMMVAEKCVCVSSTVSVIDKMLNIFGIRDVKSVSMTETLADMGMDSLMKIELRQVLEREFGLFMTNNELNLLTLAKIFDLAGGKETGIKSIKRDENKHKTQEVVNVLLDSSPINFNRETHIIRLASMDNSTEFDNCILIVPGIEGVLNDIWKNVALGIKLPVFFLQFYCSYDKKSVSEIAETYVTSIKKNILEKSKKFSIIGYSYGAIVAIELARQLEGYKKTDEIIVIDGGPDILTKLFSQIINKSHGTVYTHLLNNFYPPEVVEMRFKSKLDECRTAELKLNKFMEIVKPFTNMNREQFEIIIAGIMNRVFSFGNLNKMDKLESSIRLFRANRGKITQVSADFGLSKLTKGTVEIDTIEGDHITVTTNPELVDLINKYASKGRPKYNFAV